MKKIYDAIIVVCKLFLLLQVVVVSMVVIGRYVIGNSPVWGEELSILCMVWFALLSVSIAIKDGNHIRMTIIEYILPKKVSEVLAKLIYLVPLLLGIFLVVYGIQVTELSNMSILPSLRISSAWLYGALPAAGLCMVLMTLWKIRGFFKHD